MKPFNGVKVFSATMHHDRDVLGEKVTAWMVNNPSCDVVDVVITQSSDQAFHCIAITVFYLDKHVVQQASGQRLKFGAEQ